MLLHYKYTCGSGLSAAPCIIVYNIFFILSAPKRNVEHYTMKFNVQIRNDKVLNWIEHLLG